MKKHTEKQPIDDLFARKLGDMSITPSAKSWDELQNRMGKGPTARIVPVWYRYAAAAACVVLVGGIGWKFYQSAEPGKPATATIARVETKPAERNIKQQGELKVDQERVLGGSAQSTEPVTAGKDNPVIPDTDPGMLAKTEKLPVRVNPVSPRPADVTVSAPVEDRTVAQISAPAEKMPVVTNEDIKPLAAGTGKAAFKEDPVERKLVVVINTPAEVTAKAGELAGISPQGTVTQTQGGEDEGISKAGKLFKKLKRIKNGEALAYKDDVADEEESGLISRLYGNVRQSLETKKVSKR